MKIEIVNGINEFERTTIEEAYSRCYGLQHCVQTGIRGSIDELAHQTGLRTEFIVVYLDEIKRI